MYNVFVEKDPNSRAVSCCLVKPGSVLEFVVMILENTGTDLLLTHAARKNRLLDRKLEKLVNPSSPH